jgi:hypothetical protein
MDESSLPQNRRARRSHVYLTATLQGVGARVPVKLRNLSALGALVEGTELPGEGSPVTFNRNELSATGRVAWVDGKHAGIAFDEQLQPEQVLRHVPAPRQKMVPAFRRPGLACREMTADERRLIESWYRTATAGRPGEG